ncbi:MAG: ATP-binding cassette domain-containing protein [Microbacteriaceae bacterium]|nr:ATP-binding cassette domain-containing protein [Microbacteriaceae bacterium]
MTAEIMLDKIAVQFGQRVLFDEISVRLSGGDAALLVGRNGAGKTSLLQLLAGHIPVVKGEYTVLNNGENLDTIARKRIIGAQIGEPVFLPDATPKSTLALQCEMFGMADNSAKFLQEFRLNELAEQDASTLSKGEQKRLALARAFCTDPSIILLDEPEDGLDKDSLPILDEYIKTSLDSGKICVIVTHEPDRYAYLAPQTIQLTRGKGDANV